MAATKKASELPVPRSVTSGFWSNDPEWLRRRDEEWPRFQRWAFHTYNYRACERYFFTGQWDPKIDDRNYSGFLIKIRFHPGFDPERLEVELSKASPELMGQLRSHMAQTMPRMVGSEPDALDDLMPRILKCLYPNPDGSLVYRGRKYSWPWLEPERPIENKLRHYRSLWSDLSWWLRMPCGNPHFWARYLPDLLWALRTPELSAETEKPETPVRDRHARLFSQCAHYREPGGLPGIPSHPRQLVEHWSEDYKAGRLPPYCAEAWDHFSTRLNRAAYWATPIDPKTYHRSQTGYDTYGVEAFRAEPQWLEHLVSVHRELGFTSDPFDPKAIVTVNLAAHLHKATVKRLGYEPGEPVPAYRYHIETTEEFTDAPKDMVEVAVDFLLVLPKPGHQPKKPKPVLLMLQRPKKTYDISDAVAWPIHQRWVAQRFAEKTGVSLCYYKSPTDYGDGTADLTYLGPFHNSKEPIFKTGNQPILDTPKQHFPPWQGEPLPPLRGF